MGSPLFSVLAKIFRQEMNKLVLVQVNHITIEEYGLDMWTMAYTYQITEIVKRILYRIKHTTPDRKLKKKKKN